MGIVWDSGAGRTCPRCELAIKDCTCAGKFSSEEGEHIVRLRMEKSGRKGKTVTVITGLPADKVSAIFKALKKRCAAGGALKDTVVEIQGEHRDTIRTELERRSLQVRG